VASIRATIGDVGDEAHGLVALAGLQLDLGLQKVHVVRVGSLVRARPGLRVLEINAIHRKL
jgi:hypothetical protein